MSEDRAAAGRPGSTKAAGRILELAVRDLALIERLRLELEPGLNVLTGETGAGKSMLVDALALLLGERAASGSVRPGAAKTIVEGAFEGRTESAAYVQAVAAGVDVLLYPRDLGVAAAALGEGKRTGTLTPERVSDALERVEALLARQSTLPASATLQGTSGLGQELADRLLAAPPLRGTVPPLRQPLNVTLIDDDVGGPYPASPANWIIRALEDEGVAFGSGGSSVVIAYAEPRAWKGRGGWGQESLARLREAAPSADLILLFAHPRLAAAIPGRAPIVIAWHRQRLLQEAVARWLMPRVRR